VVEIRRVTPWLVIEGVVEIRRVTPWLLNTLPGVVEIRRSGVVEIRRVTLWLVVELVTGVVII
jgi:hypothetical protein